MCKGTKQTAHKQVFLVFLTQHFKNNKEKNSYKNLVYCALIRNFAQIFTQTEGL